MCVCPGLHLSSHLFEVPKDLDVFPPLQPECRAVEGWSHIDLEQLVGFSETGQGIQKVWVFLVC